MTKEEMLAGLRDMLANAHPGGHRKMVLDAAIAALEAAPAPARPSVVAFAQAMEQKLRENDHKGGWTDASTRWLVQRLREEARELEQVLEGPSTRDWKERIRGEAADVANFAMMVADVMGALEAAPSQVEAPPSESARERARRAFLAYDSGEARTAEDWIAFMAREFDQHAAGLRAELEQARGDNATLKELARRAQEREVEVKQEVAAMRGAAQAVVDAQDACDAEADRCRFSGQSPSSAPAVRSINAMKKLRAALAESVDDGALRIAGLVVEQWKRYIEVFYARDELPPEQVTDWAQTLLDEEAAMNDIVAQFEKARGT